MPISCFRSPPEKRIQFSDWIGNTSRKLRSLARLPTWNNSIANNVNLLICLAIYSALLLTNKQLRTWQQSSEATLAWWTFQKDSSSSRPFSHRSYRSGGFSFTHHSSEQHLDYEAIFTMSSILQIQLIKRRLLLHEFLTTLCRDRINKCR